MVTYDLSRDVVTAREGEDVVGSATLDPDGTVTVVVSADHRGRGVGSELFLATARLARSLGRQDVVLAAPAEDRGTMAMLASLGLRGLARLDGDVLRVRVSVSGVRPVDPGTQLPA
ncbi:GNAT family N-acetyltransferase [Nocardioides mangrovicus]|uniref:GNAT family N-acetyltransferase n=1 Tax=Nocardioides mangrovicus TaxID=2478913 RepID=A0A3L8P629_9ACTN|nr:GNAT family N-acetyltransferase [Nocardioides mangrovicus]RLV50705.1 GNAT family N-acetyltransferase [Nocardioides mangrovicus]